MSVDNISNMPFVVKGNAKEGYKLWNKDKKTFAKKTFKDKATAEKMKAVYDNFSYGKKKKVEPIKEE